GCMPHTCQLGDRVRSVRGLSHRKLFRPLKNNKRLRHLSIIVSNRSSTARSCNKRSTVAVSPTSTSSYLLQLARIWLRGLSGPGPPQLALLPRVVPRNTFPFRAIRTEIFARGFATHALVRAPQFKASQDVPCARPGALSSNRYRLRVLRRGLV